MWTPFGSILEEDCGDYHTGRACQRNGIVYRWTFKDGRFACGVYHDGRLQSVCGFGDSPA